MYRTIPLFLFCFAFNFTAVSQFLPRKDIDFSQIDSSSYAYSFSIRHTSGSRFNRPIYRSYPDTLYVYSSMYHPGRFEHFFLLNIGTPADVVPQVSLYYQGTYKDDLIYYTELTPYSYQSDGFHIPLSDFEINVGYQARKWYKQHNRRLGYVAFESPSLGTHKLEVPVYTQYAFGPRVGLRFDQYAGGPPENSTIDNYTRTNGTFIKRASDINLTLGVQITSTYAVNARVMGAGVNQSRYKQHRYFIDLELPLQGWYVPENRDVLNPDFDLTIPNSHRIPWGVRIGWEEIIASNYTNDRGYYSTHGMLFQFGLGLHISPRSNYLPRNYSDGAASSPAGVLYFRLGIGYKP